MVTAVISVAFPFPFNHSTYGRHDLLDQLSDLGREDGGRCKLPDT